MRPQAVGKPDKRSGKINQDRGRTKARGLLIWAVENSAAFFVLQIFDHRKENVC